MKEDYFMQAVKTLKRACVAAVSGAMLLMMVPEIPADAAGMCNIYTNKTHQMIRGFGGIDLPEWQGYSLSDAELARVFGNGDGQLGLSVLRVYVNPDKNQWNKCLKTAQYAAKNGATIFATPWEPPSNLAESGGNNGKLHLPSRNYGAYATHLNDFGNYMKQNGVNLYSISVQNEPDFSKEWTYWSPYETTDFLANYGDKITSTRVMSPETFQYQAYTQGGRSYYENILNNSKAMANCDVFGTHFYGTPRNKMDYERLEKCGKEIWMTEVYVPNSNANSANNWPEALDVAENIHNGLVMGNMSVYTWWYIKRSYSLIEQSGSNGAITKRGYMMGQYSKYVRPGDFRIDCTESPDSNLLISAYKHSDSQIEIVAINKSSSDIQQQFNVDGRSITDVDRYRSSQSENFAKTADLTHETSTFWANLPGKSVSTFVVTLKSDGSSMPSNPSDPPSDPITPDANGYYYHDTFENGSDNWSARGGDVELTMSGRHPYAGTNALLVQKRESAWQGVEKNLDSATFKPGQKYSFSVDVDYEEGEASQKFLLSMQYEDASGTTKYAHIAEGTTYPGQYLQLANPSFQIPSDASNIKVYVETADVTGNFYIDEAIIAKDGVKVNGPAAPTAPKLTTTVSATADEGSATVSWTAASGADGYAVYVNENGSWVKKGETTSTSYVVSGLNPGTTYTIAVDIKQNGNWQGDYSNTVQVQTAVRTTVYDYPKKTSLAYNESSRQFRVTWTTVPNAQAYGIGYYSSGRWKVFDQNISPSKTTWTSPKIPRGSYKVVILAKVNGKWQTKSISSRAFTVTIK